MNYVFTFLVAVIIVEAIALYYAHRASQELSRTLEYLEDELANRELVLDVLSKELEQAKLMEIERNVSNQ